MRRVRLSFLWVLVGAAPHVACGSARSIATAHSPAPIAVAAAAPTPIAAAEPSVLDRGSFAVSRRGHGPAVILIPGLTCGGDVWEATAQRLQDRYEVHVVSLSGFAGRPPIEGPLLPRVRDDLVAYIEEQSLTRPAVVGHSLGGFLALWLGATAPDRVGPIVTVDGLPSLAAAMNIPEDDVEPLAARMRDEYAALDTDRFAAQTRAGLATMIVSLDDVEAVAQSAVRSDPATVGRAAYELLVRDLRDRLAAIETPVLLFGPGAGTPSERAHVEKIYRAQVAAIPNHEVVFADGARHFVMLDAAAFFATRLDAFLAAHHAPAAVGVDR